MIFRCCIKKVYKCCTENLFYTKFFTFLNRFLQANLFKTSIIIRIIFAYKISNNMFLVYKTITTLTVSFVNKYNISTHKKSVLQ